MNETNVVKETHSAFMGAGCTKLRKCGAVSSSQ